MNQLKICIAGVTGWVGKALVPAVLESNDMKLVSAISRKSAGRMLSDLFRIENTDITISGTVGEALEKNPDVLIDYTSPESVKPNIMTAINRGVNVVVGTSGLTDNDYAEIDDAAQKKGVGVIAAGNFAISAALMLRFATIAARFLPSWEILDYASSNKIDSPSGTANELAFRIGKVSKPEMKVSLEKMVGPKESRGANLNDTQVHSIRLPGYIIGADVKFGGIGEKLTLSFEGGNEAGTYVEGTLLAARKVSNYKGLVRGLDNLLDL